MRSYFIGFSRELWLLSENADKIEVPNLGIFS